MKPAIRQKLQVWARFHKNAPPTYIPADPTIPVSNPPDPQALAKQIQQLILAMPPVDPSSLPFPFPGQESGTAVGNPIEIPPGPTYPDPAPPAPLPFPFPPPKIRVGWVNDAKLIKFLNSAPTMNADTVPKKWKGKKWMSVWEILDSLPNPLITSLAGDGRETIEGVLQPTDVMFYGPLIPGENSVVEVAKTAIVPIGPITPSLPGSGPPKGAPISPPPPTDPSAPPTQPPVDPPTAPPTQPPATPDQPPTAPPTVPSPPSAPPAPPTAPPGTPAPSKQIVWIPSTTKVSFQAMWWGFRIYLPPPVMAVLNTDAAGWASRSAVITTALTWIVKNIPVAALPPPLQAAIVVLGRIIPIIGYIASFISWSWGQIKSFDKGDGVILNATWLLPIALIPTTLDRSSYPKPDPAPLPAPAPAPTTPKVKGTVTATTTANGTSEPPKSQCVIC